MDEPIIHQWTNKSYQGMRVSPADMSHRSGVTLYIYPSGRMKVYIGAEAVVQVEDKDGVWSV